MHPTLRLAVAAAVTLLAAAPPQGRAAEAPCGTVVVPSGLGASPDPAPVPTLHPALTSGGLYESEAYQLLYRPLLWLDGQHRIDWAESLASAVAVSSDRTRFTLSLKPWRWSDGTPITAADTLYDWQLIRALGAAYFGYRVGGVPQLIRSITAPDSHTLVVVTTRPVNPEWFELSGLGQLYPLPRQSWARYPIAEQQTLQSDTAFYRVVDGPFRLQSLQLGRDAVFVPNERYGGHHASIARFVVNFLVGANPLEALRAGQIDIATLPFELMDAAQSMNGGFRRVVPGLFPQLFTIIPNLQNDDRRFLRSVAVRQAVARAIDQKRLIAVVYHGLATEQHGFVPSSMTDYLPPGFGEAASPLGFDPAAARKLLDDAGYAPGPDGVRTGHGERLAFSIFVTAGAEERLLALQIVQADLRRVGIALDIKEVEFNQLIARMLGPPAGWDSIYLGWDISGYPDPTEWFQTGSSGNYAHYSDPTMDRLLAAATTAPDRSALFVLEDYIRAQQPMIFLPSGSYANLARPGIDNIDRFLALNATWLPEYLTLSGPMACDAPHA